MNFKNRNTPHIVYALMLDGKPVYVGCCIDLKRRTKQHRRTKKFDYSIEIKTYECKQDALLSENAIIRFLSLVDDPDILNSRFENIVQIKIAKES